MTTHTYCLSRHLDTAAAPPTAAALSDMRGKDLNVDGSEVQFAGALSLQVLAAARAQWEAEDHAFRVAPLSKELAVAVSSLGLELSQIGASASDIVTKETAP